MIDLGEERIVDALQKCLGSGRRDPSPMSAGGGAKGGLSTSYLPLFIDLNILVSQVKASESHSL